MARHLLSFLGNTKYMETTYQYGEDTCSSEFVLHALLNTVCKDWGQQEGDKISVFITDEARAENWVDVEQKEDQKAKKGLETYLTEHFQQKKEMGELRYGVDIQTVDIVKGTNEVEIWKLFNQLTSPILKDDELYLDVTNSFRAIPLLMSSAAIFARSIQGAKIQAIYYAAFEKENPVTPIVNLAKFVDIINWSVATELFVKTGNMDLLGQMYQNAELTENAGSEQLADMMQKLQTMIAGLDNSQGAVNNKRDEQQATSPNTQEQASDKKQVQKETVLEAYEDYLRSKQSYDLYCDNEGQNDDANVPLRKVTDAITNDLNIFGGIDKKNSEDKDDSYRPLVFGMNAVRWYIQKGRAQTGFTALDETMKTYICVKYHLDETSFSNREMGCQEVCRRLSKLSDNEDKNRAIREQAKETWKVNNPNPDSGQKEDQKRLKNYYKAHQSEQDTYPLLFQNGNPDAIIDGMTKDFVKLKNKITNSRNSMNHFGFTENSITEDPLQTLKEYYNEFVEILQKDNPDVNELKDLRYLKDVD